MIARVLERQIDGLRTNLERYRVAPDDAIDEPHQKANELYARF